MRDVIQEIEALLQKAGFTDVTVDSSTHSHTLSAKRGEVQAVVHMSDQEELSYASGVNKQVPMPTDIHMRASLPGVSSAELEQLFSQTGATTVGASGGSSTGQTGSPV